MMYLTRGASLDRPVARILSFDHPLLSYAPYTHTDIVCKHVSASMSTYSPRARYEIFSTVR